MKQYKTKGKHLVIDVWLKEWHDNQLVALTQKLGAVCNFHIIQDMHRYFPRQGITYLAVLDESHLAIHTYPEHKYLSVDIYTCGVKGKPSKAIGVLRQLGVTKIRVRRFNRG